MGFRSEDGTHYVAFPEKLKPEQLDKLPTKRLLSYFKKFREIYYWSEELPEDIHKYFRYMKHLLKNREHLE
jgi:hypothetical protein